MGLDPVGYVGFSVVNYTTGRLCLVKSDANLPRLSQPNPQKTFQASFSPRPHCCSCPCVYFYPPFFFPSFLQHVPSLPPARLPSFLLPSGLGNRMPAFQHGATPLIPAVCAPLTLQALRLAACLLSPTRLLHACLSIIHLYSFKLKKKKIIAWKSSSAHQAK